MSATRSHSRRRSRPSELIHKAAGAFHPRVQRVGAEHFGIVSVDCAKARSKWMLCDFFGKALIPPAEVEHQRTALDAMVAQLRRASQGNDLQDVIVAVAR